MARKSHKAGRNADEGPVAAQPDEPPEIAEAARLVETGLSREALPVGAQEPLDLRTDAMPDELTEEMKRFDIFLIDTHWNTEVSKAVRAHLPLLYEYQRQDTLYLLTKEQSVEILKSAPHMIGHDPIVLVYDAYSSRETRKQGGRYQGFRLNLGLLKSPEQALARLQEFIRFIAQHRTAIHLNREVRRELHREGFDGMIKLLREASSELL